MAHHVIVDVVGEDDVAREVVLEAANVAENEGIHGSSSYNCGVDVELGRSSRRSDVV